MKRHFMLMAPEDGEGGGGGGQQTLTPEQIRERVAATDGTFTDVVPPVVKPADQNNPPAGGEFTQSPFWDAVKDVEGFVMPEAITAENEQELLRPYLAKKFNLHVEPVQETVPVELHPYAKKVQEMVAANPDLTLVDITKQLGSEIIDPSKMSSDELIRIDLFERNGHYDEATNPEGLTDQDVNDYIDSLSKIDKKQRGDLIRESIINRNKQKEEEFRQAQTAAEEQAFTSYVGELNKNLEDLFAKLNNTSDIYGVKLSQTELNDYFEEFKEFVTPDKTTKTRKMDAWLSDNLTLFKLYVMSVQQGEDSFRELLTQGRESAKEDIFKKLRIQPGQQGAQGQRVNTKDPDTIRRLASAPDGAFL